MQIVAEGGHIEILSYRQHLLQQVQGHAERQQRAPFRFQIKQLRRRAFRQQFGQRAKRLTGGGLAIALVQPHTVQGQFAEKRAEDDLMVPLLRSLAGAVRTTKVRGGVFADLLGGKGLLHAVQDLLGFRQVQTQFLRRESAAFKQATSSTSWTRPSSLSMTT